MSVPGRTVAAPLQVLHHDLFARQVLADCQRAFALFRNNYDREDWRIYMVAAITLLRSVGHVLHKVDASERMIIKRVLDLHWPSWKKDDIFAHFIDDERNLIIKNYEFRAQPQFLVYDFIEFRTKSGDPIALPHSLVMQDGYFREHNFMELFDIALNWWNEKLHHIEKSIA